MAQKRISVQHICQATAMGCEVLGVKERHVSHPSPIDQACDRSVSFCSKRSEDALEAIRDSRAGVIICSDGLEPGREDFRDRTLILVSNPRLAFIRLLRKHFQRRVRFGVHPSAVIDPKSQIHPKVYIGPNCSIGQCIIEEGTVLFSNVSVYPRTKIGKRVVVHAGAVLGSAGFGFERDEKGQFEKFPQLGGVSIEDDVEIGSNVSIDCGTLSDTVIGAGTKIDNLTHIAHNVRIGKRCLITAVINIAGGTVIGDDVWVGPSAVVTSDVKVGDAASITIGSVVTKDVAPGQRVTGNFAIDHDKFIAFMRKIR